jgi:hypothetical protein
MDVTTERTGLFDLRLGLNDTRTARARERETFALEFGLYYTFSLLGRLLSSIFKI